MPLEPAKQRFFIALLPPQPIQDYANEIKQHFADRYNSCAAQKSPPHITLQPPFDWAVDELPVLEQQLSEFAAEWSPIPITLEGFATFAPRVIFINVHPTSELLMVQQHLMLSLERNLGITDARSKSRPFTPHMTVAFRDLTRQNFQKAWQEFETRSLHFEFLASFLTLLIHDGHRWNCYRDFPLAESSSLSQQE
ncbi:MAG: 2'-5' RNA ligase family protein [Oscillatoriales cyanobacterium C42_A2020_001]|nr:2'-5' RNA ligase family protein [Leptolyngbyaceae cyanobacterium C42_A2020_001]